jgi:hypothetical protein
MSQETQKVGNPGRPYRFTSDPSPASMRLVPGLLKTGSDSDYRTVPEERNRSIFPARTCWIENRFVPVEPLLNAAIGLRLRWSSVCALRQLRGHSMLRVPELTHAAVRDSSECAATRRAPVRCEDWLPHYEHTDRSVGVLRQQLLSCGGPPQTSRSSRR